LSYLDKERAMKRGLVLIAGASIALVASFYISTRLAYPPNPAAPVSTLKQDKLAGSTWPLNPPTPRAAEVRQATLDPMCSARLGSLTRCT
jgi:hypothetical protein